MHYPKITVVTPNYNQAAFLETTIQSVLSQGYPNLEYIIMDGGSTDDSVNIIKKYEQQLAYWESKPDKGQYDAVQKGFLKSTGEIMTYINSDDLLTHRSLFTVAEVMGAYPQIEWLSGTPNTIDESGRQVELGEYPRWNRYRYLQGDYRYIQQEGIFWKRSLWDKAGSFISTDYKLASDMDLWARFLQHAEFYAVRGALGSFRYRSANQKSLEGMDAYAEEANLIIARMPRSAQDINDLKIANLFLFRLFRRRRFRFFLNLLSWQNIEARVFGFAPKLIFNRKEQQFIIVPSSEVEHI